MKEMADEEHLLAPFDPSSSLKSANCFPDFTNLSSVTATCYDISENGHTSPFFFSKIKKMSSLFFLVLSIYAVF
jgi:hypothetical protein